MSQVLTRTLFLGTKETQSSYAFGVIPTPVSNSSISYGTQPAPREQLQPAPFDVIQDMINAPSGLDWVRAPLSLLLWMFTCV
jgi:hypothetical protein